MNTRLTFRIYKKKCKRKNNNTVNYSESQPGVRWTMKKYSEVDLYIMLIVSFSMKKETQCIDLRNKDSTKFDRIQTTKFIMGL